MSRYEGRPFLRLLEGYILWCIDDLSEAEEELLNRITPSLQKTFDATGSWQEIVADQMEFSADTKGEVQKLWELYSVDAQSKGGSASAVEFAKALADRMIA